ncbi:MAG: archaellin/type IV pilin N-terminal domain-containing protein [Candidatus Bathyarchaeia archaeon]
MKMMKKMKKKGISPVIASIILIAITVAIAIAVAGWVFGLFGTYTTGTAIKISSVNASGTKLTIVFDNSGASGDTVTKVELPGSGITVTGTATIVGNSFSQTTTFTLSKSLTVGQTYTVRVTLASGNIITHTFIA